MKTSLGIWALGPMVTRFVPAATSPTHDEPTPKGPRARSPGSAT